MPEPAQIARYTPDGQTLLVTSLRSATATAMDATFERQTTLNVGEQPVDAARRWLGDAGVFFPKRIKIEFYA